MDYSQLTNISQNLMDDSQDTIDLSTTYIMFGTTVVCLLSVGFLCLQKLFGDDGYTCQCLLNKHCNCNENVTCDCIPNLDFDCKFCDLNVNCKCRPKKQQQQLFSVLLLKTDDYDRYGFFQQCNCECDITEQCNCECNCNAENKSDCECNCDYLNSDDCDSTDESILEDDSTVQQTGSKIKDNKLTVSENIIDKPIINSIIKRTPIRSPKDALSLDPSESNSQTKDSLSLTKDSSSVDFGELDIPSKKDSRNV